MPAKRWNFCKAKWNYYIALTNKFSKTLLPPDSPDVKQDFCDAINSAAKRSIPRGRRNNHIPCWDAECENLCRVFLRFPDGNNRNRAATSFLTTLDRKLRDRWSEAVQSIGFSYSSRKAWNILNNLTGRSRHTPRHSLVSADVIVSQLVRPGRYEDFNRKSS